MRLFTALNLEDPEVQRWMNEHFKAGEYMILSFAVPGDSPEAWSDFYAYLKIANLNIVVIPSGVAQIMVNLKELPQLQELLEKKYKVSLGSKAQAFLDFATDSKKGTLQ